MNTLLTKLHNQRLIWRANQSPLRFADQHSVSGADENTVTGFSELDQALDGHWPQNGVIAVQAPTGIGEIRLLLPSLTGRYQQQKRLLVIINPPWQINAEMLCELGFDLKDILILHPADHDAQLWSAEQCLKSGCCDAVMLWPQDLQIHQVKRLQLAARQGDALNLLIYPQQAALNIPVSLALDLTATPHGLEVTVKKRQGGWRPKPFQLSMQTRWPKLTCRNKARPDNVHFLLRSG